MPRCVRRKAEVLVINRKARMRKAHPRRWELRVYVMNSAAQSQATLTNLEQLCDKHVAGRYRIEVIDLKLNPQRSRDDQIVAIPTVVRCWPLPERRVIGTLADAERAAAGLELGIVN